MTFAMNVLRDEEQRRLARDMHDDLGQLLAAFKIDLCALQQVLPKDGSGVADHLERLHFLADAMTSSVRRIIADLPPKDISDVGLFSALEHMGYQFSERYSVQCSVHISSAMQLPEGKAATTIYRLVQESLNNVAKHAEATQVEVRLTSRTDALLITVSDNGKGISLDAERKCGSFGLISMRERIAVLGGTFNVSRNAIGGTLVSASMPLDVLHE